MNKPLKCVVNVGLARCGTTSTAKLFADKFDDFATPRVTKELKFFFGQEPVDKYFDHFDIGTDQFSFESSPPYCHRGIEDFQRSMGRIMQLKTDLGLEVHILFNLRNLLQRAFSHYWHDIDAHHAAFGKLWAVKKADHPRRYESHYRTRFRQELRKNRLERFLPRVGEHITHAIAVMGAEHVHVAYTKALDAAMADFLARLDAPCAGTDFTVPRTSGAAEPVIFRTDNIGRLIDDDVPSHLSDFRGPADSAFLITRRLAEIVDGSVHDIALLKSASKDWTRRIRTDKVLPLVAPQIEAQVKLIEAVPDHCFLSDCKADLLHDLTTNREVLKVKPRQVRADDLERMMQARQSHNAR